MVKLLGWLSREDLSLILRFQRWMRERVNPRPRQTIAVIRQSYPRMEDIPANRDIPFISDLLWRISGVRDAPLSQTRPANRNQKRLVAIARTACIVSLLLAPLYCL